MFSDSSILEYEFYETENDEVGISLMVGDSDSAVEVLISYTELKAALAFVHDNI